MEYNQLSVSDGTGEAVLANIESDRAIAAITIDVDSVENFPNEFIFATGTKNANNFITPATMTVGYGHLDSGNVVIDGFAPGYADDGNTAGQILVIKPTTYWADEIVRLARVSHEDDGTPKQTSLNPVGSIIDFAGTTAPDGWLLCYGQALDASVDTEYQALYDVIGNIYGGTDNTDFIVPDLRGRVVAGQDNMGGVSANRLTDQSGGVDGDVLGDTGGSETHTLTLAESAAHSHSLGGLTRTTGAGAVTSGSGVPPHNSAATGGFPTSTNSQGGGGAHNNVQPTIILNKIIKF